MTDEKRELTRRRIEAWKRVAPALERVEVEELAHQDAASSQRAIDALIDLAAPLRRPRTTSGLVEQQRLFMKARGEGKG
jgi:hypothetical protein